MNKRGRGLLGDATYQISRIQALWFQTRRFFHVFPIYAYVKHMTPRAGHFYPQGYNLNKLGRGLLGGATYQLSSLWSLRCQTSRGFFTFSLYKPM